MNISNSRVLEIIEGAYRRAFNFSPFYCILLPVDGKNSKSMLFGLGQEMKRRRQDVAITGPFVYVYWLELNPLIWFF